MFRSTETKSQALTAALLAMALFASSSAWAQVQAFSVTAPTTIPDPYSIFTVEYTLGGSKLSPTAQLRLYLAPSRTGTSGRYLMWSTQLLLRAGSGGLYLPPTGVQSASFTRATVQNAAAVKLDEIAASCQPQTWYIQAEVDYGTVRGDDTVIGTAMQPDFYFTSGTLNPSTIQPGGSTSFSFTLANRCTVASPSTVGVYLADVNYQLLSYIGGLQIGTAAGPYYQSPISLTFSPYIAPGTYYIILIADEDDVIAESNENNNGGFLTLNIVSGARQAFGAEASPLSSDVPTLIEAAEMRDDLVQKF